MVKICCYGTCRSDTRYPDRLHNDVFFPFPKPKSNREKCLRWIKACGRPHSNLNVNNINKDRYVCSKHFKEGQPSVTYPDPIPADGSDIYKSRRPPLKRILNFENCGQSTEDKPNPPKRQEELSCSPDKEPASEIQPCILQSGLELLSAASRTQDLERENAVLKKDLASKVLELHEGRKLLSETSLSKPSLSKPSDKGINYEPFSVETVLKSNVKDLFKYYTGFQYSAFTVLFEFLIPDVQKNPLEYKERKSTCMKLSLKDQLLLVLCRLRNGLHFKDLAFRFHVSIQIASIIFNTWIQYMYLRLGCLSLWPHRDVLIDRMPKKFREEFPTTLAIVDCTEIKTERPTSLQIQSQCYSEYKSSPTLKALVVTNPRGSVMFTTSLFTGSISDNEIVQKGHFLKLLQDLIKNGKVQLGDGIMVDKGFRIDEEMRKIGLELNIPPLASVSSQMKPSDVALTRKIASHRVHVERAIQRIKCFKLIARTVPISLFGIINEIWLVCCYLTTFQDVLVREE